MKISILFGAFILVLFTACNSKEPENATDQTTPTNEVMPNEVDQLMLDMDADEANMPMAQSLLYTKEDNTMTDAKVFFDKNEVVAKISDYYLDGTTGMVIRTSFYFNGGIKFAARRTQELKNDAGKPYFSEIVTFYDKKGKATSTKQRRADFEELLENETFFKTDITQIDEKIALQKINMENEFAVTFQGFVESGPYEFLIVGENKANGYSSSLSIQTPLSAIGYLKNRGKEELGTPLVVQFERMIDSQGYEMQLLLDVKVVKESK